MEREEDNYVVIPLEDGGFLAYMTGNTMPTAFGETQDEAKANLMECIEEYTFDYMGAYEYE